MIHPAVAAAHAQRAANRVAVPPVSGPPIPQVTAADNGIYSIMAQHMPNNNSAQAPNPGAVLSRVHLGVYALHTPHNFGIC
jgi:hypothetical protein